jgi:hypothetical protein
VEPIDQVALYDNLRTQEHNEQLRVLASNGPSLSLDTRIRFHVMPSEVSQLHQETGEECHGVIRGPVLRSQARRVVGRYTPRDLLDQAGGDRARDAGGDREGHQNIVSAKLSEPLLRWKPIEAMDRLAMSSNAKVIMMGGRDAPVIVETPRQRMLRQLDVLVVDDDPTSVGLLELVAAAYPHTVSIVYSRASAALCGALLREGLAQHLTEASPSGRLLATMRRSVKPPASRRQAAGKPPARCSAKTRVRSGSARLDRRGAGARATRTAGA